MESYFEVKTKEKIEQQYAEEALARIMIRQNCSFYLFDDVDLKKLFVAAHPKLNVTSNYKE